jgi:hypothetical protein
VIEDVMAVATSSIRARSRPRALVGVWAWETALSLAATLPAVALARAAYGRHPGGDAPLWAPGSLPLLGLLSREANGVHAATTTAAAVLMFGAVAGLVPLAALMISISRATRDGRAIGGARTVDAALRAFRPLAILLVLMGVGQGLVVATAFLVGEGAQSWTSVSLGEARAQELAMTAGAAVLLGAVVLGVMHDLARAAVIRFELGAMTALAVGARALRDAPIAVSWSWAWRALASLAPIVAVALLADRIGGRGGVALLVLAALHQSVILSRVALRASWLAKAMRTVDAVDASDGVEAGQTGETDDVPEAGDLLEAGGAADAIDHLDASDR